MNITEDYLEDEVREGFYVSGMIKKIWASSLSTLDFVDRFCREHNIRWFLFGGSMLGAVRHQGFIPWDDDADIIMLREDFNRFVAEMSRESFQGYYVAEQRFKEYDGLIPIITNSKAQINYDADFLAGNHQNPYAATLDLFAADTISDNEQDEEWRDSAVLHVLNAETYTRKLVKEIDENDDDLNGIGMLQITERDIRRLAVRHDTARLVLEMLGNINFLTDHRMDESQPLLHQLNVLYTGLISYFRPEEGSRVRIYPDGLRGNASIPRSWLDGSVRMPFENMMLPVPSGYDAILRYMYHDYQKKVIGTSAHEYPSFAGDEEKIIETCKLDKNPFLFSFTAADLPENQERMSNPKTDVRKLAAIISKMGALMRETAAEKNLSNFLYLLETMQNGYMQIGSIIENSRGEAHSCIHVVEQICETLYRAFENVQREGGISEEEAERLSKECADANEQIRLKYADVTEVLFVVDRAKNWKAVESLYRACAADPECHVKVMPVPWRMKEGIFDLSEKSCLDKLSIPDSSALVSENEYDIATVHPDVIITTYGYDHYNYVRSTDVKYYTKILYKETDRLIYIPWFTLTEFEKGDPQWATVPYFARIPGVLYADQTVVQSERVQRIYIDAMEEMDTSVPEQYWEEKILPFGSPLWDAEGYDGIGPDEDKAKAKTDDSWGESIWKALKS